ncbi:MarR family transcriptional regulator [Mycolicibacterium madagascariense]|uniref:MarR family transcriptional regulator n=1 Tax=Mycolicibacterium madagascariense TaxID=212765 RepID=A0A7I7XH24_9MYCO|nr:MarR family transcriptional regulator [Mycolicibacterium madagascariense]MCV7014400.1 MarR family transcriptional regulator [Mycolicibacterium madagascariense]BBZ28507.1 MarR family transcriptional regulator [Mycolicibacterium madagascariense]
MPTVAAETLSHLIGPLRRALLRATLRFDGLPDIPDAQVELLRAMSAKPSATPGQLADELGLARSTVSNLIKALTAAGLATRTLGHTDARNVEVEPTAQARTLLKRYDRASSELLDRALQHLSADDRRRIDAAMPALGRLRRVLEDSTLR